MKILAQGNYLYSFDLVGFENVEDEGPVFKR